MKKEALYANKISCFKDYWDAINKNDDAIGAAISISPRKLEMAVLNKYRERRNNDMPPLKLLWQCLLLFCSVEYITLRTWTSLKDAFSLAVPIAKNLGHLSKVTASKSFCL